MTQQPETRKPEGASWVFYGLVAVIFWLPLPYGSNVPWAVALLGIAVFLLLALWLALAALGRVRISPAIIENRWIFLIWLAWLGWIAFQLIPLSAGQLQILTPYASELRHSALVGDGAAQISIVPERTYESLLKSCTYFGLYLLVLLTITTSDRLMLLASAIVLSGVIQAVYGSLMTLSGLEYGFLSRKTAYLGFATGTFVNRNHLAGYMEICAAVGVGMVVSELRGGGGIGNWRNWFRHTAELIFSRKFRTRVFVGIMVIALVLTRSRMGNTAFFVALMISGCLYVLLRERRLFLRSVLLFSSFLLVDLLIVSNWFGLEKVVERVEETSASTEVRSYVFPEWAQAIDRYWIAGSGLGTFSVAALPFRTVFPRQMYNHAHNDYAEFLIETGVIGLALLAALVIATVVHALRVILFRRNRLRTGMAFAGLMAMSAIAIHATVDFNLQIPANAATLVVIMAMVNSCSHQSRKRSKRGAQTQETAGQVLD